VRVITDRLPREWRSSAKDPKGIPLMGINRARRSRGNRRRCDGESGRARIGAWFENFTALWRRRGVALPKNIAIFGGFRRIVKNEQA